MSSKRFVGLAVLLATASFAATPMAAQAGPIPHWFSNGKLITNERVIVKTSGTLTFDLTQFGVLVTCKVTDSEVIFNPATGGPGVDEMLAFRLSRCTERGTSKLCPTKMEVIAHGLSWPTHLAEEPPAPGIRDVIEGIQLEFRCAKGKVFGTATGTLNPRVGNSVLVFEGGALASPFGAVTVKGNDKLIGPKGDEKITAA